MDKQESLHFGVLFDSILVGVVGFNSIDKNHKKAEIGYWLAPQHNGHGIMTQAVAALTDYGFKELLLHRIEIKAAQGNEKSKAIPVRLGFHLDGLMREEFLLRENFVNHVVYSMLEDEWKNR